MWDGGEGFVGLEAFGGGGLELDDHFALLRGNGHGCVFAFESDRVGA